MTAAAAAAEAGDTHALEEAAMHLAGHAVAALEELTAADFRSRAQDERAITEAVRHIEARADDLSCEALSLAALARGAEMGPYRFLRLFQRVIGVTPHQYILHLRLQRAAVRLLTEDADVSAIAYDAGFADLSTFNRRFRTILGRTPSAYRAIPKAGGAFESSKSAS